MAHMIEFVDGVAQIAYAGEVPWHGLGKQVPPDLAPIQMLEAAGLDWDVQLTPCYAEVAGELQEIPRSVLYRTRDNKILDVVSDDWHPVQNLEAFEFFNDFVANGDMEMHTAGSLRGGQIVWALARVKESFELFRGDRVDAYLLFSNFHKYGFSTDVRFTPVRAVCNNTLTLALSSKVERMAKFTHRNKFDPENAKEMLGIATNKLSQYKEMAAFLGSKKAKNEDIVSYFKRIFPITAPNKAGEEKTVETADLSRNATTAIAILDTQPGAKYAAGSWWQPYNAVTFMTDHVVGRSADTRLTSAWYGSNKNLKTKALELAVEMAEAA